MNQRIRELAEQAGLNLELQSLKVEKFAELIVKECGAYLNSPEFIGRSDLDWSMVLNEHFGVEE